MNSLFRKRSMERISSPEQLNAYIRVATPSVWLLLAAIVILLTGVCVWGVWGHMDTTLHVACLSQAGSVTAYVREEDARRVGAGDSVLLDDSKGSVLSVSAEPVRVDDSFAEYLLHVGGLRMGEWVYVLQLDAACPEGVHAAQIVIDSVSPMSFVLN